MPATPFRHDHIPSAPVPLGTGSLEIWQGIDT